MFISHKRWKLNLFEQGYGLKIQYLDDDIKVTSELINSPNEKTKTFL